MRKIEYRFEADEAAGWCHKRPDLAVLWRYSGSFFFSVPWIGWGTADDREWRRQVCEALLACPVLSRRANSLAFGSDWNTSRNRAHLLVGGKCTPVGPAERLDLPSRWAPILLFRGSKLRCIEYPDTSCELDKSTAPCRYFVQGPDRMMAELRVPAATAQPPVRVRFNLMDHQDSESILSEVRFELSELGK